MLKNIGDKVVAESANKFKVNKDYPTINGMLYKNDIVFSIGPISNNIDEKIRVKDTTGKIWFIETKNLIRI